jgi:hypothetical protein
MKKLMLTIAIGLTPFLLIPSATAADTTAAKADTSVQVQKPSLTYYYLDG